MMRTPKFHRFPSFSLAWPDVVPGDVLISPETLFYQYQDFHDRDEHTQAVVVKYNPMLVLARIDGSIDGEKLEPHYSTFILFSIRKGVLVTVMSRGEKHRGHLGA